MPVKRSEIANIQSFKNILLTGEKRLERIVKTLNDTLLTLIHQPEFFHKAVKLIAKIVVAT